MKSETTMASTHQCSCSCSVCTRFYVANRLINCCNSFSKCLRLTAAIWIACHKQKQHKSKCSTHRVELTMKKKNVRNTCRKRIESMQRKNNCSLIAVIYVAKMSWSSSYASSVLSPICLRDKGKFTIKWLNSHFYQQHGNMSAPVQVRAHKWRKLTLKA